MDRCPTPLEVDLMIRRVRARARALAPATTSSVNFVMGMGGFGPAGPPPGFPPVPPPAAASAATMIRGGRVPRAYVDETAAIAMHPLILEYDAAIAEANRAILTRAWLSQLP